VYDRRLHRERSRLTNERIQHVNRVKGLLALHGIYDYEPMHPERMQRLERLRTAARHRLPPHLKAEILRELQRLELVLGRIRTVETERDAIALAKSKLRPCSGPSRPSPGGWPQSCGQP
jgi:transposase